MKDSDLREPVLVRVSGKYIVCFIFGTKPDCGPMLLLWALDLELLNYT